MRGTLFAAFAAVLSLMGAQDQSPIFINESNIRAALTNNSTVIAVPVQSELDHEVRAGLTLDWIDNDDRTLASAHQELSLPTGGTTVELPLAIPKPTLWLRLRYSLAPAPGQARAFAAQSGIVALPEIAGHVFELKVTHVGVPQPGRPFVVHAQAIHPVTNATVDGLRWNARLTVGGVGLEPKTVSPQAEGLVDIVFDVPASNDKDDPDQDDEAKVWIQGRRGDFWSDVLASFSIPSHHSARLQTDKPIYQPGQTIHLRAVIFDPQGRAAQGAKVTLKIDDQDNNRIHTAHLVASRFGVVQEDWMIPPTSELGTYQIALTAEDDEDYAFAHHVVRVSRYELPAFSVTAKPDQAAYLVNEKTKVTVTGTYLFGKPVPGGHVKVTRSDQQTWNARSHKDETKNDTLAEGQAGEDGTYIADLDLADDQEELQRDNGPRFRDVHLAAYYTDPASNRTEQRRFDVRITREPIHVYIITGEPVGNAPVPIYVSTDYADGTPASTRVEVHYQEQTVTLHTNRYGVGKAFVSIGNDDESELTARASDASGRTGTRTERYWRRGIEYYRLETARTVYRAGESVELRISALPDVATDRFVVVNAVAGDQPVASRIARLVDGKASVAFPYQSEFRRTIMFAAWNAASPNSVHGYNVLGSRAVIFPDTSELHVTAATERAVYKPGEKATLHAQVSSLDGHPLEAAIGLAVVDQAVLERARGDTEFGQRPWFACAFCADDGESQIGGIRLNDLYAIKPSTPISPDLDLVAEALVARTGVFIWSEHGESIRESPRFSAVTSQMRQIQLALDTHYSGTYEFPKSAPELAAILGRQWTDLYDPWGMPYRAKFRIQGNENVVELNSSGPDKHPDTPDDFVAATFRKSYFKPFQMLIAQILKRQQDYPATAEEFLATLRANGLLLDALRDPWGTPYQARVQTQGANRYITISSAGPDGRFATSDDFVAATFLGSYFHRERAQISQALQNAPKPPQTLEEFLEVLKVAGIDASQYRDAWGRPYRVTSAISFLYSDRVSLTTAQVFGGQPSVHTELTPVTERVINFAFRSAGADGQDDTYDDFEIARFSTVLAEKSSAAENQHHAQAATVLHGKGAIVGLVTDPSGAVVPNATVALIDAAGLSYETSAGTDGMYQFVAVPPGVYSLRASVTGFRIYQISQVPVASDRITKLDISLEVGAVSEQVTVAAEVLPLNTETSSVSAQTTATPRVRDYFPETLFWLPEAITDSRGRAQVIIPIADSVTTWKVAAIASTIDGRIAEADSDFRSFQPFFLDFNPPQVLTQGDRVDLPVAIRNYQDHDQKVSVNVQPNDWSEVSGSAAKQLTIPADSSVNVGFTIAATNVTDAGRERIAATSPHSRDAIEKPVRVHPDGQQVTQTAGDLVAGQIAFSVAIPPAAIAGATRAELRLYPNVASMLLESAAGILETPHGCAEQTLSAGYANLIALRYAHAAGIDDPKIEKVALSNITQARDSLRTFEASTGGISYWGTGEADIGVTAYALTFLVDASEVVPVDKDDLSALIAWLQKNQSADGKWKPRLVNSSILDRETLMLTALVVRSLAAARKAGASVEPQVLGGAYHQLAQFTDQVDDPYMLAQFILAALDSGDEGLLGGTAGRLALLSLDEKGALYWDLRANSPFFGWGTAGRFETTGLVISALSAWRLKHPEAAELDPVIRCGLVFLLRGRDRDGSWYSTQATVRAMRAMADASAILGNFGRGTDRIDISINGRPVKTVVLPSDPHAIDPVLVDMSGFLSAGDNRFELKPSGAHTALLRFTSTHWLPWTQTEPRQSPELRLQVGFDRASARAGEPIRCSVRAERVGFRGYGMMLAEIGLPPATEVDRSALEALLDDGSLGIDRYEVLPDRALFYLWPTAGGVSFDFTLRARIPMTAKSTRSVLYDYYNPEALSEVAPSLWSIR